MSQRKNTSFTLLTLPGNLEVFCDKKATSLVLDALKLYEVGVPPRDALAIIGAVKTFMETGNTDIIKEAVENVDIVSIAMSKFVGTPVQVKANYKIDAVSTKYKSKIKRIC